MKAIFRKSFTRDLERIKNYAILERVKRAVEHIEIAIDLHEIKGIKALSSAGSFYRIRVGNYRIGVTIKANEVEFLRCLHRRDIYRYFP